jgi:hypothetical protein
MLKVRRRTVAGFGVVALASSLAFAGVAVAALPGAPTLVSPKQGHHVRPGHITLIVRDTAVPSGFNVFVQISRHRKLGGSGTLARCTAVRKGCDFLSMKAWKGHPGEWIFKTNPNESFGGWWATTPGRYYWQADHVDCSATEANSCQVTSRIGSFRVS